ncbi:IS1 family transposase [Sorangium sp. So ce381]|uniref:IS1 family transposase n=1 Tax=Sorangium sp. So ce381 TaxID=3133307 RepID=UPI003F5AEC82
MANVLPAERRLEVLAALVNGTSIRAASRMTGVHQDTIGRFGQAIGEGCARLHDRLVRDLTCALVDLDEQHSWCRKRQNKVDAAKDDAAAVGEQWTWAAICRTSKLIIAWHVGKRDQESADALVEDVRARLVVMPQITTDGLGLYAQPIATNFGRAVPYMQTVKNFSSRPGKPGTSEKFAVERGVDFIQKRAIFGTPDPAKATNYAIERSNLTARQWNARLRRRTLAFSKKLTRHRAAVALHYVNVNLCHIPRNMRITPAMAAGVTDHVWSLEELMVAAL